MRRLPLCEDAATNLSRDVRNHTAGGVFARGKEQTLMREDRLIFEPIGKALHACLDDVVQQPLPREWIELMERLNGEART